MSKKKARVYLVGAGPGDPSLLTLQAVDVLGASDVVLYDRLLDKNILKYAPQAKHIPVGKKARKCGDSVQEKSNAQKQKEIINELIRYSTAGLVVTRLKGGDPLIFGRGGEEMMALAEVGIPFTLVPGVSSFYSVAEFVGIPITYRGVASSFGVFTAHGLSSGSSQTEDIDIDWKIAVTMPTLVFLMGLSKLSQIVSNLLQNGRAPETDIAVISCGTLPNQKIAIGNLGDIIEKARDLETPATIIVGDVVALRKKWANSL